jgi:hypothetical protein
MWIEAMTEGTVKIVDGVYEWTTIAPLICKNATTAEIANGLIYAPGITDVSVTQGFLTSAIRVTLQAK